MKKQQDMPSRILGRKVGRVISQEEMVVVSGGLEEVWDTPGDGGGGGGGGGDWGGDGGTWDTGPGSGNPGDPPPPFSMEPSSTNQRGTMTIEPGPYGAVSYDSYYTD